MKNGMIMAALLLAGTVEGALAGIDVDFTLLTWSNAQATGTLPTAVGLKPSSGTDAGDWLVFTADDVSSGAAYNPTAALSHNLAELSGTSGSSFNTAPSLTGALTLTFAAGEPGEWNIVPKAQQYIGVATPVMQMNQFLIGPGDPSTQNAAFNVDGVVAAGTWQAGAETDWAIHYDLDFYFATNVEGDPSPSDVDATFDNATQRGYLLPVDQLTVSGLAALELVSPSGFFAGDFEAYLLDEIAPRLPADATYLLVTQMDKINPVYTEIGLPITTGTWVGNTTIAYTTQTIPEPSSLASLVLSLVIGLRRRRS